MCLLPELYGLSPNRHRGIGAGTNSSRAGLVDYDLRIQSCLQLGLGKFGNSFHHARRCAIGNNQRNVTPILSVSATQIAAQVPWEVVTGQTNVVVTNGSGALPGASVQISQYAPALMGAGSGTPQALAFNADGSFTAPPNLIPGVTAHPATAGDTITLYATGLGPLDQAAPGDGFNSSDMLRNTSTPVTVTMAGTPANVVSATLASQYVGVYQIMVVVPPSVMASGAVGLQLSVGGVQSPANTATIALQ